MKKKKKQKQKYSQEFIDSTVKLVETGDNAAAVARDLGIEDWKVRSWVRQSRNRSNNGNANPDLLNELKQLKRENARLKEESEILKKAAAFFARHQK